MKEMNLAVAIGLVASALAFAAPAQAGLVGSGGTVQAFYNYSNTTLSGVEAAVNAATNTTNPASLASPVDYLQGALSGSTIHVGDTQIVIKNLLSGLPYCFANTPGTACVDQINGFDLVFTGQNILGVSVNPASAPGMLPVSGTFQGNTHLGLQLISPNEIRVDLAGDLPNLNDELILDLQFGSIQPPPPPGVPEPGSVALLGVALLGLGAVRRRRQD